MYVLIYEIVIILFNVSFSCINSKTFTFYTYIIGPMDGFIYQIGIIQSNGNTS